MEKLGKFNLIEEHIEQGDTTPTLLEDPKTLEDYVKYKKGGVVEMLKQYEKNKLKNKNTGNDHTRAKETYRDLMIEFHSIEYIQFTQKEVRHFKDLVKK